MPHAYLREHITSLMPHTCHTIFPGTMNTVFNIFCIHAEDQYHTLIQPTQSFGKTAPFPGDCHIYWDVDKYNRNLSCHSLHHRLLHDILGSMPASMTNFSTNMQYSNSYLHYTYSKLVRVLGSQLWLFALSPQEFHKMDCFVLVDQLNVSRLAQQATP